MLRITFKQKPHWQPLSAPLFTSLLFASLFFSSYTTATTQATKLPPVLEFEPNCAPKIVATETLFKVLVQSGSTYQTESAAALKTLLLQMRQLAADKKADALIIRQLATKSRKQLIPNAEPQRRLTLVADLINFCPDDTSLSDRTTRFDKNGAIPFQMSSVKLTFHSPEVLQPVKQQVERPVRSDVSLNQGAYGLLPGMTQAQVLELAGPPDIQLTLQTGQKAWAYGRYLWLVLDDKLQQVHYQAQVLSGYGINLTEISSQFEREWLLDGKLKQRTSLDDVKRYLAEQKLPYQSAGSINQPTQLRLHNNQHQLILYFEQHQMDISQPAVPLLTEFSLLPKGQQKTDLQPLQLDWQQLLPLLAEFSPEQQQQKPQLSSLTALLALPHFQVLERKNKSWLVFGDYLQLHVKDNELQELRLTPAFSIQQAEQPLPEPLLLALKLPKNGQQFKIQFPQTESFSDKLLLSLSQENSSQSIEVMVNPDSPEQEVEQVLIRYY